jgi:Na+-transporting methylmalonyl-CoA/oxaloacetate decarboxylase gamma subunit
VNETLLVAALGVATVFGFLAFGVLVQRLIGGIYLDSADRPDEVPETHDF